MGDALLLLCGQGLARRGCKKALLTQPTGKGWSQGPAYPELKLEGMQTVLRSSSIVNPLGRGSA